MKITGAKKNKFKFADFQNNIERDSDIEILFHVYIRGNQAARIDLTDQDSYENTKPRLEFGM